MTVSIFGFAASFGFWFRFGNRHSTRRGTLKMHWVITMMSANICRGRESKHQLFLVVRKNFFDLRAAQTVQKNPQQTTSCYLRLTVTEKPVPEFSEDTAGRVEDYHRFYAVFRNTIFVLFLKPKKKHKNNQNVKIVIFDNVCVSVTLQKLSLHTNQCTDRDVKQLKCGTGKKRTKES